MSYVVERTSPEVLTIRHTDIAAGWEQRYLLISDVHFDSPHCDRRLLTKHLTQAKEVGAGILCIGDWFDAMGGKNDKRASKSTTRVEDKQDNYFDALVDHSAEYLTPYADNLVMLSQGNHETAIIKHNETDLLGRLCRELGCQCMGYSGFIRMMFQGAKGNRTTKRVHFFHGAGGGGPVTKQMIGNNRKQVGVDADIYLEGHIHVVGYDESVVQKMTGSGKVLKETRYLLTIPGYKEEYTMTGGYHIEKGRQPKPLGGWTMVLYYDRMQPGNVGLRFERAN